MGLAVLAALALGACRSSAPPGGAVVDFVTWRPNHPQAWERVYELFARRHPEIRLRRQTGPHSSTAYHDMLTQKLKNRSRDVDVFLMDVTWPPEFASAGWALPLEGFLPPEGREAFLPGPLEADTWRGRLYALPLYVDGGLLYYRKDLLEKYGLAVPGTWEDLLAAVRVVKAGEGPVLAGYVGQFKQYEGLVCNVLEFLYGRGGRVLEPGGGCGLGGPEALAALDFLRRDLIGPAAPRGVLTYQEPESLAVFLQGRALFMRNWPYAWAAANDPARSKVAGRVGLTPLPGFAGGRPVSILGGWQVGLAAHSNRAKEAWTFASFLTSPEVQRLMALEAGQLPALRSLYQDPEVLAANPHFETLGKVLQNARPRPKMPLYAALSDRLQIYFHRALTDPGEGLPPLAASACREVSALTALTGGE